MKKQILAIVLFFTLVPNLLSQDKLDFSTSFVREIWYACFKISQVKSPYQPATLHVLFCDCLIDKGRNYFGSETGIHEYTDNTTRVWTGFANDCGYEINLTLNPNGFNL
tara:strand:+ start:140 stop:466 length:327 start_codon:yes stop_codon:yes gene_type:complete